MRTQIEGKSRQRGARSRKNPTKVVNKGTDRTAFWFLTPLFGWQRPESLFWISIDKMSKLLSWSSHLVYPRLPNVVPCRTAPKGAALHRSVISTSQAPNVTYVVPPRPRSDLSRRGVYVEMQAVGKDRVK